MIDIGAARRAPQRCTAAMDQADLTEEQCDRLRGLCEIQRRRRRLEVTLSHLASEVGDELLHSPIFTSWTSTPGTVDNVPLWNEPMILLMGTPHHG